MAELLGIPSIFRPNVVDTPSAAHIEAHAAGAIPVTAPRLRGRRPLEPQSMKRAGAAQPDVVHGVRLKLDQVRVTDGLEGGLFGLGAAKGVYLVTSIVDGLGQDPIAFKGQTYRGLENGADLPLGPTMQDPTAAFTVYMRQPELPQVLSFSLLAFRSAADLRELGEVIAEVTADEKFKTLSGLVQSAATAANPAYGLVWQVAENALSLLGSYLKAKPDDQLGYYQANYTRLFDNLGAGKHPAAQSLITADSIEFAYAIDVA